MVSFVPHVSAAALVYNSRTNQVAGSKINGPDHFTQIHWDYAFGAYVVLSVAWLVHGWFYRRSFLRWNMSPSGYEDRIVIVARTRIKGRDERLRPFSTKAIATTRSQFHLAIISITWGAVFTLIVRRFPWQTIVSLGCYLYSQSCLIPLLIFGPLIWRKYTPKPYLHWMGMPYQGRLLWLMCNVLGWKIAVTDDEAQHGTDTEALSYS